MTETLEMTLGGRTFAVPRLPLGVNRVVYPLCRELCLQGGLLDRLIKSPGGLTLAITSDDIDALIGIVFPCAELADPELTRQEFNGMPITPMELFDAFFSVIRYQTGMWAPVKATEQDAGEAMGEASPPLSTSIESSPA